jgi:hypothetical protein
MMVSNTPKYAEGDIVYEIVRPQQLMVITKRNGIIYYCDLIETKNHCSLAFVERDLRRTENKISLPKVAISA